jgi:hypothetical protein
VRLLGIVASVEKEDEDRSARHIPTRMLAMRAREERQVRRILLPAQIQEGSPIEGEAYVYPMRRKEGDEMTMDKRDKEALDAHITGQHEEPECQHPYISWHGGTFSRGECQDCGEIISAPINPDTDRILTKLFDQWRDDIIGGTQ